MFIYYVYIVCSSVVVSCLYINTILLLSSYVGMVRGGGGRVYIFNSLCAGGRWEVGGGGRVYMFSI